MTSKINNTYGAGYRIEYDFDAKQIQEDIKKQRKSHKKCMKSEQGLGDAKRQTWMVPFSLHCTTCSGRLSRDTKVYAHVQRLGPERKYLNKVWVYSLKIRCPKCHHSINFETDPEHRDYKVVKGGTRIDDAWSNKAKESNFVNSMATYEESLIESQRNQERVDNLQCILKCLKNEDIYNSTEKVLSELRECNNDSESIQVYTNKKSVDDRKVNEGINTDRICYSTCLQSNALDQPNPFIIPNGL